MQGLQRHQIRFVTAATGGKIEISAAHTERSGCRQKAAYRPGAAPESVKTPGNLNGHWRYGCFGTGPAIGEERNILECYGQFSGVVSIGSVVCDVLILAIYGFI